MKGEPFYVTIPGAEAGEPSTSFDWQFIALGHASSPVNARSSKRMERTRHERYGAESKSTQFSSLSFLHVVFFGQYSNFNIG